MREITWDEAIEIAQRRRDNMNGTPLFVMFNGAKGDFESLRSMGIIGQMVEDENRGEWYVNTGLCRFYQHSDTTVWVG